MVTTNEQKIVSQMAAFLQKEILQYFFVDFFITIQCSCQSQKYKKQRGF
jgi:hypothetical protein